MKRLILLAVLIVAFCAMPAFASTQNVKVNGDIGTIGLLRDNFDLGANGNGGFTQSLFITQTRVGVSADLTDNVSVVIKMINERPWTDGSSANTDVDLNQAYAQFREFLYSPLTATVGLAPLRFGNALIIGDPNTNNRVSAASNLSGVAADLSKEKAFNQVRATLDYNPLTVDIFAAKINANILTGPQQNDDDVDLFGANANYKLGDSRNSEVEAYFFAKVDNSFDRGGGSAGVEPDTVYVPGLRASTNPIKGMNIQGEVAWQKGSKATVGTTNDNQRRDAIGGQIITSYQVNCEKTKKYHPVLAAWGTWLSGDSNGTAATDHAVSASSGEKFTGWDPMFEDQSGGTIYNTLFDYSNVRLLGGSLQITPIEDVVLKSSFTSLWLDKNIFDPAGNGSANTILRQPDGTTVTSLVSSNTHIGNEFDVDVVYNYSEDVQIGASLGWFMPGGLFSENVGGVGNDDVAKQLLVNADVSF